PSHHYSMPLHALLWLGSFWSILTPRPQNTVHEIKISGLFGQKQPGTLLRLDRHARMALGSFGHFFELPRLSPSLSLHPWQRLLAPCSCINLMVPFRGCRDERPSRARSPSASYTRMICKTRHPVA